MSSLYMCPVCDQYAISLGEVNHNDVYGVDCTRCGLFNISHEAQSQLFIMKDEVEKNKISAVLRENSIKNRLVYTVTLGRAALKNGITIDNLLSLFPRTVSDRIDRTLQNLVNLSSFPSSPVHITEDSYPIFFSEIKDLKVTFFILKQLSEDGYIQSETSIPGEIIVTAKGWNRVSELEKKVKEDTKQVFIAMWFDKQMDQFVGDGFEAAIKESGYEPFRIDWKEHNEKIDDQIISEIKKSKFLVADVTGHRGGVYFEAGYALGLGMPVIWTCKEDHLKDVHFDTRQYNHIVWTDVEDLRRKLYYRIQATIE
ncbi:hypothetical protein LCY76_09420 [Fictibacillus sp. KIGAM418]|uniref:Nucleoside 2-deoxyribosyltransferase n=1 Tax=Fictibacillus marinisediminis TaxID=2878389 RepID=A0A9X2BGS0_9BACL|nr:hypothetical protein [Fictibacillus marinisediminis]MCK6256813.1 hypothetical protein [Fictibacillus marinisediminis]